MIINGTINHNKGKIVYVSKPTKAGEPNWRGVHIYRNRGLMVGSPFDLITMIMCFKSGEADWKWTNKTVKKSGGTKPQTVPRTANFDIELIDEVIQALQELRTEAFGVKSVADAEPETKRDMNKDLRDLGL